MDKSPFWKLDEFDTGILNIHSYKHTSSISESAGHFRAVAELPGPGFYSVFLESQPAKLRIIQDAKFVLIGIRNTYILEGTERASREFFGEMEITDAKTTDKLTSEQMLGLARSIWQVSRYHNDTELPAEKSLELYRKWVENSLCNGYAKEYYIARIAGQIAGICTVKMTGSDGCIDLLGVLPEYRGKAIGSRLLSSAIGYLKEKHAEQILVITEGENVPANRLYQKNGFILRNVELVYHRHVL